MGMLLAYTVGTLLEDVRGNWRLMLLLPSAFVLACSSPLMTFQRDYYIWLFRCTWN